MSLATKYLGLDLLNPLVASASPLNNRLDNIRRLEDAGAGAIVMASTSVRRPTRPEPASRVSSAASGVKAPCTGDERRPCVIDV